MKLSTSTSLDDLNHHSENMIPEFIPSKKEKEKLRNLLLSPIMIIEF
jgi:hypothetical protein